MPYLPTVLGQCTQRAWMRCSLACSWNNLTGIPQSKVGIIEPLLSIISYWLLKTFFYFDFWTPGGAGERAGGECQGGEGEEAGCPQVQWYPHPHPSPHLSDTPSPRHVAGDPSSWLYIVPVRYWLLSHIIVGLVLLSRETFHLLSSTCRQPTGQEIRNIWYNFLSAEKNSDFACTKKNYSQLALLA